MAMPSEDVVAQPVNRRDREFGQVASEIVTTVELVLGNGNGNYNPPAPVNGHGHHDEAQKP